MASNIDDTVPIDYSELSKPKLISAEIRSNFVAAKSEIGEMLTVFQGEELIPAAGVLTVPLDGKSYYCTPSENITSIVLSDVPIAPDVNTAVIYFIYDAIASRTITSPETWHWKDNNKTLSETKPDLTIALYLCNTPQNTIQAFSIDFGTAIWF